MIGFLSDFGHADPYVGICHGVMARFAPDIRIIDICHEVQRGEIRAGAAMLAQAIPYLPPGVFLAVVDPGVGTKRRGIVVTAGDSMFVGPDNGLLLWAAEALGGPTSAYEITNHHLTLRPLSNTFHARDVFAPVAARLAAGIPETAVGPHLDPVELVRLPDPVVRAKDDVLEAEILTIDRYGNLQTAAPASELRGALGIGQRGAAVLIGDVPATYGETYASVPPGELVVYEDSAGLVAVAVNAGDARERLAVRPGMMLRLRRPSAETSSQHATGA